MAKPRRGFLTGTVKSRDDFDEKDARVNHPCFSEAHFNDNLQLVNTLKGLVEKKGCRTGQLSLPWILAQGPDFIPIPGTKRVPMLEKNLAAVKLELRKDEVAEIRAATEKASGGKGGRYPPALMQACSGDSAEL